MGKFSILVELKLTKPLFYLFFSMASRSPSFQKHPIYHYAGPGGHGRPWIHVGHFRL